jgi:hypothetical protein
MLLRLQLTVANHRSCQTKKLPVCKTIYLYFNEIYTVGVELSLASRVVCGYCFETYPSRAIIEIATFLKGIREVACIFSHSDSIY